MFKTIATTCLLSVVLGAGLCSSDEAETAAEPEPAAEQQRAEGTVDNANRQLRDLKKGMQKKIDRRPDQIDQRVDPAGGQ